jgi:cytochrome c oxidase subunit 2
MAGMLADDAAIRDVAAYIDTLEVVNSADVSNGNIEKGASSYVSCGACHGTAGRGNYALSAPRLAGQSDWYLKRQLQNFKQGVRGAHKSDSYGHQMALMSRTLQDEQAVDDLLAYLNSL